MHDLFSEIASEAHHLYRIKGFNSGVSVVCVVWLSG